MQTDTFRLNRHQNFAIPLPRHLLSGVLIFAGVYFITISVNAQPGAAQQQQAMPDVIQLNDHGPTVVTGTVTEADEKYVVIDSAGTLMRINLDEVELKGEADTVFKAGMDVTVEGEMTGNDFGMPVIKASTITAREMPTAR